MSDQIYDPLATPNPAYDHEDFEPTPVRPGSWERRGLAQAILARARARRESIADAFVDALLDGKLSLFRLLIDLEQAAILGEAEAEQAHEPTLAEILIPLIHQERAEAAARRAAAQSPQQSPTQSVPARPMLVAPAAASAQSTTPAQPGLTDLNAAASASIPTHTTPQAAQRPCRTCSRTQFQTQTHSRHPAPRSRWLPPAPGPLNSVIHTLHAVRQPAPGHSYGNTSQIVAPDRASRRRRPGNRTATHSKQECPATNLP